MTLALRPDDHWVSCSKDEFGSVGWHRHLAREGALTTVCGHTASDPAIWRGDTRKLRCPQCIEKYMKGNEMTETKNETKDVSVQERASLHEKAVQAVANGTVAPVRRKTRKAAQKRPEPAPLHTDIKVDTSVMEAAKKLIAEGVYTKLEIVDNETVIVR